jgi:uncharacterized membrane protein
MHATQNDKEKNKFADVICVTVFNMHLCVPEWLKTLRRFGLLGK